MLRETEGYLVTTLTSLLDSMTSQERADTLILVLIAETDPQAVSRVSSGLQAALWEHLGGQS